MGFSVQVTFAAKGESPFTLRVAQPKVGAPLVAKKVLKSFALGYERKCGARLDVGSLGLSLDAGASASALAPGADVRSVASDGSTLFVVRRAAAAPRLEDAVAGRSTLGPLPSAAAAAGPALLRDGAADSVPLAPARNFRDEHHDACGRELRATLGDALWGDDALWTDVLKHRGAGRLRRALSRQHPSACYLGGSITEQREGWRPRFHAWLGRRLGCKVRAVDAFCGNAGSTLLAFTTKDWVVRAAPDVIFVEVCINDGDGLLEAGGTRSARGADVPRALEGIVRGIREALPDAAVVFVEMYLRDDLPKARRSGTKAWVDADASERAAAVYHDAVVRCHGDVARRYDCAQVDLVPFFRRFPARGLDALFRDDCHHTEPGADYAASAVARCVHDLLLDDAGAAVRAPPPRPLDANFWRSNGAHRFDADPNFLAAAPTTPGAAPRRQPDRCPVTGATAEWTWLFASDGESARCHFDGTALGILTHVGPDSGKVAVSIDGAPPKVVDMVDQWCYYWRSTIVMLATDLPRGFHNATITVLKDQPDRTRLKRPIVDRNFLDHPHLNITPKLWLMWFVSVAG